ncbi:site-specific integrase [Halococcus sp. IIIV-5B]|nr:site-specific integrase [Halococcus sp. IIIV-5B]
MSDSSLTPVDPQTAVELYLESRSEASENTLRSHKYRLRHFIRWCEDGDEGNIQNLNSLTGRDLHEYRVWRKQEGDLNVVSVKTQLSTIRVFMKFCESIDGVEDGLSEKMLVPTIHGGEGSRDALMEVPHAETLLEHLRKYDYASRRHITILLLWHTGMRIGALHSLDVKDFDEEDERLSLNHRPETGTRLKNKSNGERYVALSENVCEVLKDYLSEVRPPTEDDSGRQPLLTSQKGRPSRGTLRGVIYRATQPCVIGECPLGNEQDACEYYGSGSPKCPESVSPHSIRRGSITHFLSKDVPEKVVSDRMNVDQKTLSKHYDRRTEEQQAEQRRQYLGNVE